MELTDNQLLKNLADDARADETPPQETKRAGAASSEKLKAVDNYIEKSGISNISIDEAMGVIVSGGAELLAKKYGDQWRIDDEQAVMCGSAYASVLDEEFPDMADKLENMSAKTAAVVVTGIVFIKPLFITIMQNLEKKKEGGLDTSKASNDEITKEEEVKE